MATDAVERPPNEGVLPNVELIDDDGEPMESGWHVFCMLLLIEVIHHHFRNRKDFWAAGNQFIYFNLEQARNRDVRGPDFYVVLDVPSEPVRKYWCVWEEGGRYPNVIIELLSESTARIDLTVKKKIYEKDFRTPNYYCYDPETRKLLGWQLENNRYEPLPANEKGWLWCPQLELWLGSWQGQYQGHNELWLRFYESDGRVVPIAAEAEQQRADAAEARLAELERRLKQQIDHAGGLG